MLILTFTLRVAFEVAQSACTSMCRPMYNWNILDTDIKQQIHSCWVRTLGQGYTGISSTLKPPFNQYQWTIHNEINYLLVTTYSV